MSPPRRDRARKAAKLMEARVARAVSGTSFSRDKRPPLDLPETARFFFQHLPRRSRGGAALAANVEWERKTALRNSIRDAYLRALARLPFNGGAPTATVPSLLPALLAGGHCFGPLPDAASNVIVNTVWIRAASPLSRFAPTPAAAAAGAVVEDFVYLDDIEQGSFAGLMRVLPIDDADRDYDYYYAAAVAAKHPDCEAFAAFAQSGLATSPAVAELLAGSGVRSRISAEDIERLSSLLVPPSTPPLQACLKVPEPNLEKHMRVLQQWSRKLAGLAIRHWNRTIGGPELQLHVVFCLSICDYAYQHINFMASPRDNPAAIQLFFAEHANEHGVLLCCPVQDSVSRSGHCSRCEGFHERIIHPSFGAYNYRSPLDATLYIIDFDVANLLDIKYARHLWGSRYVLPPGYADGYTFTDPSTESDLIIIR